MDLRYWIANALTGEVLHQIKLEGRPSFSSRFGGGTFRASISLVLLTRDRTQPDWPAIINLVDNADTGRHSILVTGDDLFLGEWWIWRKTGDVSESSMPVEGFEYDGYPESRRLASDFRYGSATDQFHIARDLLAECFRGGQTTMNMTVPTVSSGVTRTLDRRQDTQQYGDVLRDLTEAGDGFEWRVIPELQWQDGDPVQVDRRVEFGAPVLAQETDFLIDLRGPGSRGGNATSVSQRRNMDRLRTSRTVWGSGQGSKQRKATATDGTYPGRGYPIRSDALQASGETSQARLQAIADGAITRGQELFDPVSATLILEKLGRQWPRLGDIATLEVEPTYALPHGVTGQHRIGQVSFSPAGSRLDEVSVLAVEQEED